MSVKKTRKSRPRRQKGSALLVSLMIMVGLSLLGLGFVLVSETESAIATNDRNYHQAQVAAELGAKTVVEWFQDAQWSSDRGLLPKNDNTFKTQRTNAGAHDYYKPNPGDLLCDIPLKGDRSNKFFGADPDHADILISYASGGKSSAYLDALTAKLFYKDPNSLESLRISDIRIYSPPWPGAQPNADKYYDSSGVNASTNPRYGVATVRVTAQKLVNGQVRAERSVKVILAETPFPTVDGAIETSGSLVGQGNFKVYWGKILSEKNMQVNRPAVGMPWFDAKNQMSFEYGYDSPQPRRTNQQYYVGDANAPADLVTAPTACMTPTLATFAFRCTNPGTTTGAAPDCAVWQAVAAVGGTVNDTGGVTWTAEAGRPFAITPPTGPSPPDDFYINYPWLYQMTGQTLEDPWLHARARGALVYGNGQGSVPCSDAVSTHPCDYTQANSPSTEQYVATRYSNFFQNLITTDPGDRPESIEAVFPTMDYEFWKAIAQSGSNDPDSAIYYFEYAGDGSTNLFKGPGGKIKTIETWMNAALDSTGKPFNGLKPGFYFFDTQNSKNPQFNKGGILTPDIDINSGTVDQSTFQIRGYVYLNAANFGSKGVGNLPVTDVYSMPGEPYRDVGYREVDKTTLKFVLSAPLPAGTFNVIGASNGQWDYEDVNGNGQFDIWTEDITRGGAVVVKAPDGSTLPSPTWVPVPYFEGCEIPDPLAMPPKVPAVGKGCSEPHEPFLNLTYPAKGSPDGKVKVEWYDPNISNANAPLYRKSKTRTGLNTTAPCTKDSKPSECTSNGYDKDGALVTLSPILWGAIYNEGGYAGSGNADYYGAVLMRGNFNATGTPNVWFDECLAHGCLESQLKMQRVMVSSMETD
jgi:hypothetical protein